jgi:fermentation-respiration switch protein FrsA (DUF1100 family)
VTRAVVLLVSLAVLLLMLRWFEYSQVYHPSRNFRADGSELGHPFENLTFTARDGVALNAWFYPASTNAASQDVAVLVCHGNAGNIGDRLDLCSALLRAGANVLLLDYRGYGRSAGSPSEEGTYLDAEAAYDWLRQRGFASECIIAHGESLGGGVASGLAERRLVGGLVLQSTFTSVPDIGAELFPWLPVRWLSSIKYDTQSRLPQLNAPVLILHGRSDSLIRFHHAERNFAAARQPKWLVEIDGDHNDGVADPEAFAAAYGTLLTEVKNRSPAAAR